MIFHPENMKKAEGSFVFSGNVTAIAHPCLNKPVFCELWKNFTFQASTLTISESDEYIFSVGNVEKLALDGNEYSIHIQPSGVCVYAADEKNLIRGFMTLLDRLQAIDQDGGIAIATDCCEIRDRAEVAFRAVHFCIFPETELWELHRFIRFCAALKYTHIVLEFWGMLKYNCMKELAWSHGFTKEQIRPLIAEAKDLGVEIVPMFNHWGHASACRVMHGKHVILDQNPTLQTYFSEDGWCWDIRKPKVRALLREIRNELTELCGEGSYFHIGCDEAYNFAFTEENMEMLSDFINEISREMNEKGRRVFVWGDMFLYRYDHYNPKNRYTCNAPSPRVEEYFLSRLDKSIIIADWQYHAPEAPVETSAVFRKAGFDCVLCPWDCSASEVESCITTAKESNLMGIMHTTWHTLSSGMLFVLFAAVKSFEKDSPLDKRAVRTYSAALMRKVMPANGDYKKSGWAKYEIGVKW